MNESQKDPVRGDRPWLPWLEAAAAGSLLGLLSLAGDSAPGPLRAFANAGCPWLVLAFLVGARMRTRGSGTAAGALVLVIAVLTYYGVRRTAVHGFPDLVRWPVPSWCFVAGLGGAALGAAGAAWRRGLAPIGGVATLVGCLAAEVSFLATHSKIEDAQALVVVEAAAALSLPWVLLPLRRSSVLAAALGLALGAVGWAGIVGLIAAIGRVYA